MSLKFKPAVLHSIRGTRYYYEVTKVIKNTPGFSPETYTENICDVVVKFLESEKPYVQFQDSNAILSALDLLRITGCAKKGFIKKDFEKLIN